MAPTRQNLLQWDNGTDQTQLITVAQWLTDQRELITVAQWHSGTDKKELITVAQWHRPDRTYYSGTVAHLPTKLITVAQWLTTDQRELITVAQWH